MTETLKSYLVIRSQKRRVIYRRWWRIPPDKAKRESVEAALVEATAHDGPDGDQVVHVEQLIVELEKRGWRRVPALGEHSSNPREDG